MSFTPVHRSTDNELVGFIQQTPQGWDAATIFKLPFAHAQAEDQARSLVLNKGLEVLTGTWHYYDQDDKDWCPCVLKEATEDQVTVVRTDMFGYQDGSSKQVVLHHPTAADLKKQ